MKVGRASVDPTAVFLNLPYDATHQDTFVGMAAALLALGRIPRCTLELRDKGQGRPNRIFEILERCRVSFHDISAEGRPPRFNMPFELGMAYALRRYWGDHDCYVFEARLGRAQITLSDVKIEEISAHKGNSRTAMACVLDLLGKPSGGPDPRDVDRLRRQLLVVAAASARRHHRRHIFFFSPYHEFRNAAISMARKTGFLA